MGGIGQEEEEGKRRRGKRERGRKRDRNAGGRLNPDSKILRVLMAIIYYFSPHKSLLGLLTTIFTFPVIQSHNADIIHHSINGFLTGPMEEYMPTY